MLYGLVLASIFLPVKSFFKDGNGGAISLKRVSQIINKEVPFVFADCRNEEQLETIFEKVWFFLIHIQLFE